MMAYNPPPPVGITRGLNPCFGGSWVMIRMSSLPTRALSTICLNPCFGGSWVMIVLPFGQAMYYLCLNPCFGGSWVMIPQMWSLTTRAKLIVLILVLVEVGL